MPNIQFPGLDRFKVEIHTEGNWEQVSNLIGNLAPAIQDGYDRGVEDFAYKLLREIKSHVGTSRPPAGVYWQPKAETSRNRDQFYYVTGLLYRNLDLRRWSGRVFVGVQGRFYKAGAQISLVELMKILEYGSYEYRAQMGGYEVEEGIPHGDHIPPRPLMAPSLKAVGGRSRLKKTIITSIRSEIMRRSGLNTSQIRIST